MIYLDTETCGFHGAPVLIQYAQGNDDPTLYEIWKEKKEQLSKLLNEPKAKLESQGVNLETLENEIKTIEK